MAGSFALVGLSGVTNASENKNTLSLGYAWSHYNGGISGDSPGYNIKYNMEPDGGSLGLVGSLTRTSSELSVAKNSKGKVSHLSVMAGPSYRFNDVVNIYGLLGVAHERVSVSGSDGNVNNFAYGAGLRLTPIKNWSLDASYEHIEKSRKNITSQSIGTWVLGVGYTF